MVASDGLKKHSIAIFCAVLEEDINLGMNISEWVNVNRWREESTMDVEPEHAKDEVEGDEVMCFEPEGGLDQIVEDNFPANIS